MQSTALWRGYEATFEVKDSQLYVKDIKIRVWKDSSGQSVTKWISVLAQVFPGQDIIKADWFSGLLTIPYGKLIHSAQKGKESTFDNYILFEIQKGQILQEKPLGHKAYLAFKERQFQAYKKTQEYQELVKKLSNEGWLPANIDDFLKGFVLNYTATFLTE